MKPLQALLYKEWRDQRALALGGIVLCILFLVIARVVVGPRFDPTLRTHSVLPICLCVFAVAVGTEAIVRDTQNGVEGTLRQLAAPRWLVWLSKLLLATLATGACLAVLSLVEVALRLAEHKPALGALLEVLEPNWLFATAAVASACMACACVLRRSLPAALLGIALLSVVPLLASALPIGRGTEWVDLVLTSWTQAKLCAFACGAALLASLLAFRVRRPDGFGLRRAAGAAIGAGVVLVPLVAGSARNAAWALDIRPFGERVEVRYVYPSPNEEFLALQVGQAWSPRSNWLPLTSLRTGQGCRVRYEVWILDRKTGVLKEIDERFRAFPTDHPWDSDGRLVTVSAPGAFGDGEYTAERIDPRAGVVASSHPETEQDSRGYREARSGWCSFDSQGSDVILRWKERNLELRLPRGAGFASSQPGIVFHEQDGYLVRHELESGSVTKLAELPRSNDFWCRVSPSGRHLQLFRGKDCLLLDAADGTIVESFEANSGLMNWSQVPGRICLCRRGRDEWYAIEEDRTLTTLPVRADRCQELGSDRILAIDYKRIECMKLDGSERQVLYQARP